MKRRGLMVAVLAVLAAGPALAVPLPPDSTLTNPDVGFGTYFSTALPAYVIGANLVDTMVSPYVGAFTGTATSWVYVNPGTGFLTFVYKFTNTGSQPTPDLIRATIGDPAVPPWLGVGITDAGADGSGSSTPTVPTPNWSDGDPYFLLRDPNDAGAGLTIQWRALSAGTRIRGPSNYSSLAFFETDRTMYRVTNIGILDTGSTANAKGFAPSLIPEPATLALLGLGGLGLVLRRRRH